jgi:uncharacterized delta-60 repeat protein
LNDSFGDHGHVVTDVCGPHCGNGIDALAVDSRARVVAAGESEDGLALARYLPDGSLDRSFGHQGVVTTDMGGRIFGATDVGIAPRGNIVVVGTTIDRDFALARFTREGALDDTFSGGGFVTTDLSGDSEDDAWALSIRRRGKLLVAGTSICSGCSQGEFAVARYLRNGVPDPAFAGDGTVTTSVGKGSDHAFGVLSQRNGRIVVVGGSACHFALARFLGDGTLDPDFGTGGTVRTYVGGGCAVANDVAHEGVSKLVVAGPAGSLFAVGRYQAALSA